MFAISFEDVQLAQELARKIAYNYDFAREEYYCIRKAARKADTVLQNLILRRKDRVFDPELESQVETRLAELENTPDVAAAKKAYFGAGCDWGALCDILNRAKER